MQPSVVTRNQTTDDRVEREFVAAGVDADFERVGQTKFTNRIGQNSQIRTKLALKGHNVADIVHALVETAGELWRNSLSRNFFISDHGKDD